MADSTREKKAKVDITLVDEEDFKEGKVGKWSKRKLSRMDSHFTEISSKYDSLYEPIHQAYTPVAINNMQLTPDDLLLDLGAATGQLAHRIWKQVGLKNPVTCVEPCQAFFEHASKLDGIVPVIQNAEQFCDKLAEGQVANNQRPFNKILLCSVAHLIPDVNKCLGQIFDYLPRNGVCLILNHPLVGLRMPFSSLHMEHLQKMPDILDDLVPFVKSRDDVITEVTNEEPAFTIPKSRWYYMLRNRFWSNFHQYTDQEIEESIKELDNGIFKGVKDDEFITVEDKLVSIKSTKK